MSIDVQINHDSHGASYTEVLKAEGSTYRIHVLDNRVAKRGRIERWSGDRWEEVHHLGPSMMQTKVVGSDASQVEEDTFKADRDHLLKVALQITGT